MSTQIQRRRGTTAEHSTFTGVEGELTVDTTKDTVVVHDGATTGGRPLLREDQANLPSSVTNGLYTPGANQVALSTNGTGRLFISSAGLVGIGTSTPSQKLTVKGIQSFEATNSTNGWYQYTHTDNTLRFNYNGSGGDEVTITSSGQVGIGTTSPVAPLHVVNPSGAGQLLAQDQNGGRAYVVAQTTGEFDLYRGNEGTGANRHIRLRANDPNGTIQFQTGGNSERARIDSSGRLLVGTSSGLSLEKALISHSGANTVALTVGDTADANNNTGLYLRSNGTSSITCGPLGTLTFGQSSAERMRIDSSGRLLVGTSSSLSVGRLLQVAATGSESGADFLRFSTASPSDSPAINLSRSRSNTLGTNTIVQSGDTLGYILFRGANGTSYDVAALIAAEVDGTPGASGDMPGKLVFSTTADGASSPTEQLRITSDRYVRLASGTGGIQFNGDTAAANALDDYEEGTWTPGLESNGQTGSFTYGTRQGAYTKVGNLVTAIFRLDWSAIPSTGAALRLVNLPFVFSTDLLGDFGATVSYHLGFNANTLMTLSAQTGGGAYSAIAFYDETGAAINVTTGNNISATGSIRGQLIYYV